MKNSLLFLLFFVCITTSLIAQREYEYINPPQTQHEDYTISIDHIVSKEDYCKLRLTVVNKSNNYQAFDLSKVGFIYEGLGTYYPTKGKIKIIPPKEKIAETIRIDGNMNYMVEHFTLSLEGLNYATNKTSTAIGPTALLENSIIRSEDLKIQIQKAHSKRGRFFFAMNIQYNGKNNEFMTIDPTELLANNDTKNRFAPNLVSKKFFILQHSKKAIINGDFETKDAALTLDWSKVFTNYTLTRQPRIKVPIYHTLPRSTPSIASTSDVKKTKATNQKNIDDINKDIDNIHTAVKNIQKDINQKANFPTSQCGKYVGDITSNPVKVTIFSEEGECFKIRTLGETINPTFSSKVVFSSPIIGKATIMMENGASFNKSLVFNEEIYQATYQIKRNKKGKYVAKLLLGTIGSTGPTAKELAEQSAANLKRFQEESRQSHDEFVREHKKRIAESNASTSTTEISTSSSSSSSTSSNSSNSNNSNTSYRNPSSNSSRPAGTMHLRFYNGSQPLANMRVEVSTMTGFVGRGTTDSNGDVYIDASSLGDTRRINIYAKNSEAEYKLGNVIKLDNQLFAFIEPAKILLETTGNLIKAAEDGDTDQILKDFGF